MSICCCNLSTLSKKYVMAISGLLLFGFVVVHMLGNLQLFMGPETINGYAHFLKSKPGLLWGARLGLLAITIIHVVTAIQLTRANQAARPVPYANPQSAGASYASRTMPMTGLIVLAFVIYHLLHFTLAVPQVNLLSPADGFPNADFHRLEDATGQHDVYRMVILGFSNVWVSAFYILGMAFLCLHLSHGLSSLFQSLGIRSKSYGKYFQCFAKGASLIIFIGNCSMPVAVLLDSKLGWIHLFS